ncbi:MAG: PssD/Cps14F family polysaccharide biosynthesis glycosyltransferase, partial [Candidatus Eisenbacteria bacterium]
AGDPQAAGARAGKTPLRLLIPLGEGGHSVEMLRLVALLGGRYEYHYMIVREDAWSEKRLPFPGTIHRCRRPHLKEKHQWKALFGYARLALQSLVILARARPHALIHAGPAMTIPISILCRLFRVPIVFIETGSRVHTASKTGKFLYGKADLFIVQWPELQKEKFPDAVYAGLLL